MMELTVFRTSATEAKSGQNVGGVYRCYRFAHV